MLTKKQKELFDFLKIYISKNQISPSFEEMKEAVNLKSKSGIHRLITSLEQRGFIKRLKHKARAMEITKKHSPSGTEVNSLFEIPLLGSIAAGNPIEAIENADEYISVPSNFISHNLEYSLEQISTLSLYLIVSHKFESGAKPSIERRKLNFSHNSSCLSPN